jgi:Xaa-Pro aminopeptidase
MNGYQSPSFHTLTPLSEIQTRVRSAGQALAQAGLDAALIVDPVDLFYYSGTMQAGHLLLSPDREPLLMIRRDPDRAKAESPLANVVELAGYSALPSLAADHLGRLPDRIGLEFDILPIALFQRYQNLWPQAEWVDVSPAILNQRSIKSDWEIGWMRRAGELGRRVYGRAPEFIRPGRTEMDVAGLMTAEAYRGGHQNMLRMRGFDGHMYSWHVISGKSGGVLSRIDAAFGGYGLSPAFPMGAGLKEIEAGEGVLIDFGLCLNGYQVDQTRMFSYGRPPERILAAYRALERIQELLETHLWPGAPARDLFRMAVDLAERLGFGDHFLGVPGRKVRFVGHGVGLEINEPPVLTESNDRPLASGQTVALELKMVFPGLGAAGLENTYAVRESGPEKLSPADEAFIQIET